MPSMQTIFRAVVMVAVGAVAVKAWHLYGPTNEQVKTTLTQVVETVQSTIQSGQPPDAPPDPRAAAPPIAAAPTATPPATPLAPTEPPKLLPQPLAPTSPPVSPVTGAGDRVPELIARLKQLGAADTNLAPWGEYRNFYRFTCRAPLATAPTMTQHFESIAAEPAAAVEQVLAKVEAWRVAERDGGSLRY